MFIFLSSVSVPWWTRHASLEVCCLQTWLHCSYPELARGKFIGVWSFFLSLTLLHMTIVRILSWIYLSCVTFWVVLRRMVFNSRCFGTLCLLHLHRQVDAKWVSRIHSPMKMEQTQCSKTSAIKHHTPENNPKGYTRHTEHSESLKSWIYFKQQPP
jgi:hypothetical protein